MFFKVRGMEKDDCIRNRLFLVGAGGFGPPKLLDNRFTVCPLWPLGNAPRYNAAARSGVFGAGERSRTINLLITNQLLCH